jgi:hypothetical protein
MHGALPEQVVQRRTSDGGGQQEHFDLHRLVSARMAPRSWTPYVDIATSNKMINYALSRKISTSGP